MNKRKCILLVDDDRDLLITLGDSLRFEGYEVQTAENGEEGLRKMRRGSPDLIILDMNMPGMGGIGFLKELSASADRSLPPVFVFTARANMEEFFDGLDVAGFLAKPCDPEALLTEVKRIVGVPPANEIDAAQTAAVQAGSSRRVLLAEDEPHTSQRIVRGLQDAGYEVEAVISGPAALEKAIVNRPDLILTKLVLTGMNGTKLAATLKALPNTESIPIVIYDDTADAGDPEDKYVDGKTAIRAFVKTNQTNMLVKAVGRLLA